MKPFFVLLIAVLAALLQLSCRSTPPAGVAAAVNGHAITYAELEKIYKSQPQQQAEGANEDQIQSQKLEVLGSLITNEIMLQRAEKLGLQAVDADVDAELNKMKAPYTKEEFEKTLADRKMTIDDLRSQLRRQLTVDKLVIARSPRTSASPTSTLPIFIMPIRPAITWPSRRCTCRRSWSRPWPIPTCAI